jgi:hypothetical protein
VVKFAAIVASTLDEFFMKCRRSLWQVGAGVCAPQTATPSRQINAAEVIRQTWTSPRPSTTCKGAPRQQIKATPPAP